MSRVTLGDLYSDFVNVETPFEDWKKARSVEVVPRKMVEMIIERIKRNKSVCVPDSYAEYTLDIVLQYSESLLKQFEEDKE